MKSRKRFPAVPVIWMNSAKLTRHFNFLKTGLSYVFQFCPHTLHADYTLYVYSESVEDLYGLAVCGDGTTCTFT